MVGIRDCPAGTVPTLQQSRNCTSLYTVQRGDALATIAAKFNTTLDSLLSVNLKITDKELIFEGDSLCIPEGEKAMQHYCPLAFAFFYLPATFPTRARGPGW
jgi:hypothetical protein